MLSCNFNLKIGFIRIFILEIIVYFILQHLLLPDWPQLWKFRMIALCKVVVLCTHAHSGKDPSLAIIQLCLKALSSSMEPLLLQIVLFHQEELSLPCKFGEEIPSNLFEMSNSKRLTWLLKRQDRTLEILTPIENNSYPTITLICSKKTKNR
jgi:hypothetical protein